MARIRVDLNAMGRRQTQAHTPKTSPRKGEQQGKPRSSNKPNAIIMVGLKFFSAISALRNNQKQEHLGL